MSLIRKLILLSFVLVGVSSCNYIKYAKAIQEETITKFNANKEFMKRISFNGYVLGKKACESCQNVYKYRVILHLNQLSEKPNMSNSQFNPYYSFENDSITTISVSKNVYDRIMLRDKLSKKKNSLYLIKDNQEFQYLSNEENKWLP
jgi:hypothetical protein